ncbi:MAG: CRTAC1 family protein [Myxococcales bacterium]|nr:CRTAC1 family protein [Myxococcales bacterium]
MKVNLSLLLAVLSTTASASLVVGGCSSDGSSSSPTSDAGNDASGGSAGTGGTGADACANCPPLPDPICTAGSRWKPGTQAFVEKTAEWGLTGVEGSRLSVTDIDGDGAPDLVVRQAAIASDDFASGGKRYVWLLRNTGAKKFEDVTKTSGFLAMRTDSSGAKGRPGQIIVFGDVDNDGDLDGYDALDTSNPTNSLGEHSELMLNDGAGHFAFGPDASDALSANRPESPSGASFVDFDRDGNLDLWVTQYSYADTGQLNASPQQDRLYRGDGKGGFVEVTNDVGLTTLPWGNIGDLNNALAHSQAWASLACDLNGDGAPELLAASYGRAPNHLWQGSMNGASASFTNRSLASGYAYDGDMSWQDNQFARCFCQANPTATDCAGVPAPLITCTQPNWNHKQDREPFRLGGNSGSTTCADIDNDGDMDLLTSEIKHWWAGKGADGSEVLVNTGAKDLKFDRPGDTALGLEVKHGTTSWDEGHMTNAVFDFDNDGWPDLYVGASDYAGNHGLLYHQESKLSFMDVPIAEGIDHHRSHGVVFADFDADGDLDVVVGHSRARCDATAPDDCYATANVRFFENVIGQNGNFVQMRLVGGPGTNRAAIGARVSVEAGGVTQTQEVGGGHGHYGSQHQLALSFGLGTACTAKVSVRWPDAALTTESFELPSGYRFVLEQGKPPVVLPPSTNK